MFLAKTGHLLLLILPLYACDNVHVSPKQKLARHPAKIEAKITKTNLYNIFEFDPKTMKMGVSLSKPEQADFYLNSNFFSDQPIGLVVIKGKRTATRIKGGGYFYVLDGKPHIAVKSCPKITEYASQTMLWGIDDGQLNTALFEKKHARKKEFRTIFGRKKDGRLLLVATNASSTVSIKEITTYALQIGMVEGILFDGGSSVDYKMVSSTEKVVCQVVPSILKKVAQIHEPMVYIYGNLK
jgi:hypothetical protein